MKVSSVSSFNINQKFPLYTKANSRYVSAPACDLICFKSRNILDLPKAELYKKIQESLVPENFIGKGTEAEVYRIKDTDYCVKIPYEALGAYTKGCYPNSKNLYYNNNISSAEKVNHVELELSYGAKVMKYFEGEKPKDYISDKGKRYKLQSEIAKMPQKSYTEFLHQIANGIDNEMFYDYSGGNLIVNTGKNKLTAIDFLPVSENPRTIKPLTEMYLVATAYGAEQETSKKIFENIMNAGLEEFKPGQVPCMDVELFDFTDLCEKRNSDTKVENIDRLMNKISQQIKILKGLKKTEYLEDIFSIFINEKIAEIKSLIKYIK